MKFSDRVKIVAKYYEWLKKHAREEDFEIMDCHQSFLVFLETEGLLKEGD